MKIKTLLLIPFLLSSCATNNEGSNVIDNPFVASKNAGSSVVYDDVASTTEDPYKQVEPQSEEGLIYYDRSYIGVNVGPIPTVGTVIVPDQEHCPFTPQFREDMSEMVDSIRKPIAATIATHDSICMEIRVQSVLLPTEEICEEQELYYHMLYHNGLI